VSAVPPRARELWRHVHTIQSHGASSETDLLELRAALNELGRILGYDPITVEPHRVAADDKPWRWAHLPEHIERWQQSKATADELDQAVEEAET
jgi:hypothetical protein